MLYVGHCWSRSAVACLFELLLSSLLLFIVVLVVDIAAVVVVDVAGAVAVSVAAAVVGCWLLVAFPLQFTIALSLVAG